MRNRISVFVMVALFLLWFAGPANAIRYDGNRYSGNKVPRGAKWGNKASGNAVTRGSKWGNKTSGNKASGNKYVNGRHGWGTKTTGNKNWRDHPH